MYNYYIYRQEGKLKKVHTGKSITKSSLHVLYMTFNNKIIINYLPVYDINKSCDSLYQNSKIRTTELKLCSTSSKNVLHEWRLNTWTHE